MNVVSDHVFRWFLTVFVGLGGAWALIDIVKLWRVRASDRRDPIVRDKQFGYVMGIVIGTIALVGCLRFNGVL